MGLRLPVSAASAQWSEVSYNARRIADADLDMRTGHDPPAPIERFSLPERASHGIERGRLFLVPRAQIVKKVNHGAIKIPLNEIPVSPATRLILGKLVEFPSNSEGVQVLPPDGRLAHSTLAAVIAENQGRGDRHR